MVIRPHYNATAASAGQLASSLAENWRTNSNPLLRH